MAQEKKKKIDFGGEKLSVSIGEATGIMPTGPSGGPEPKKAQKPEKPDPAKGADRASVADIVGGSSQFTLHRESSGRGGRIVTAVSVKPPLSPRASEALAKAMRKGLGCGSHVEGPRIILQGDIQERAEQWFAKQGAKKVVMGN